MSAQRMKVINAAVFFGVVMLLAPRMSLMAQGGRGAQETIANAKPGNTAAGMLLAGVFLQEFIGRVGDEADARRIPWAHLDIAGPDNNGGSGYGWTPKGPSGVTVRMLVRLAERLAGQ